MKKFILLVLIIGCLLYCHKPADLYTGTLSGVEYIMSHGWGSSESWTLTFEDGQIYTIHKQPLEGFKVGELYTVYSTEMEGYLRARRGK